MGSWLGVMPFGKSMQVLVQHRFAITRDVSKYGADLLISQVMPGAVKSGVTDQNDTRLRTFLPQPPPSGGGFLPCPTGNPLPRTWRGLRPSRAGRCNTNPNMGSTKGPPRNQRASHFVPGKPTTPPGRALGCRAGSASSPDGEEVQRVRQAVAVKLMAGPLFGGRCASFVWDFWMQIITNSLFYSANLSIAAAVSACSKCP